MVIHSVFFWIKPDASAADRAAFPAEVRKLAAVRTIEKIYVGPPAPLEVREVTERSFDLALTIIFKDMASHDAYQVDPIHLAFVDGNKHLWAKVIVYDSKE